jgi:hypothetical protein
LIPANNRVTVVPNNGDFESLVATVGNSKVLINSIIEETAKNEHHKAALQELIKGDVAL